LRVCRLFYFSKRARIGIKKQGKSKKCKSKGNSKQQAISKQKQIILCKT